jgi:hypothetical protein
MHIVDRVLLVIPDAQVHKNPDTKVVPKDPTRVSPDNAINAPDAGVFTLIAIFDHAARHMPEGLGRGPFGALYSVVQGQ